MAELVIHPNLFTIPRSLQSSVPPLLRADQAEERYNDAVQAAVEKCAADTAGQTCYICMEAVHSRTGEGLVRGCACRGGAGFAHVSCLAEQAKILVAEAVENNLDDEAFNARWARWDTCRLCEQRYHGVVSCALGWGCWKTYLGRPETDQVRGLAMSMLGSGLSDASHDEEALSVIEAELSMARRLGAPEEHVLAAQSNLATTYQMQGRLEEALRVIQDTYSGCMSLYGEEHRETLHEAYIYATLLSELNSFEEAKSLLRKTTPASQRALGESDEITLGLRWNYATALYRDTGATLNDFREAVTMLEDVGRIAQQVLGGSHPFTVHIEGGLRASRAVLRARETPSASAKTRNMTNPAHSGPPPLHEHPHTSVNNNILSPPRPPRDYRRPAPDSPF